MEDKGKEREGIVGFMQERKVEELLREGGIISSVQVIIDDVPNKGTCIVDYHGRVKWVK